MEKRELEVEHDPQGQARGRNPTVGGGPAVDVETGHELDDEALKADVAFPVEDETDLYPAPAGRRRQRTTLPVSASASAGGSPGEVVLEVVRRVGAAWLVASLLAIIAAGATIWGISLQSRLNDTEDDLNSAREELALSQGDEEGVVRTVAYLLDPTSDGPETANAIVELQTEDSPTAKFTALGMPPTGEGRAFQLWFIDLNDAGDTEGAPRPSVTFLVGADGHVIVDDVPVDGPFDAVAITDEPAGGSPAPTTPPILFGTRGVAAG